jgi:hypothetical protein
VNGYLRWFRWLTWVGVVANLGFIIPSIFVPDLLEATLGPGSTAVSYVWLALAGVVLATATMFYLPAAANPLRYRLFAWLSVVGRALAAIFWLLQNPRWHLAGVQNFWMLDGSFAVIFLVLLWLGYRKAGPAAPPPADPPAASESALNGFRWVLWISVAANLVFALWALASPATLADWLGASKMAYTYLWLGNAGLLLIQTTIFAVPTASNPLRYHVYAWLAVLARVIGCLFWLAAWHRWSLDGPPLLIGVVQGLFAVVLGVLLQRGLPEPYRLSAANLSRIFRTGARSVAAPFRSPVVAAVAVVLLLALGSVGYVLYTYLMKVEPDQVFADPADQFKYGAIGLSMANRIPTYLWEVMPEVCPDMLPGKKNGWASFGILYEPGHDMPVGFSQRHIGYPSVEPNCAFCHTASYRASETAAPQLILAGSAHELDLESFQWFLYNCSSDPRFTADNLLEKIGKRHQLGWTESHVYRWVIIPFAKSGLAQQQAGYTWQKSRPPQGRGRTDTFNPTKITVFHIPDDGTIGTVDLPVIWNQAAREGMHLHWDGNNDNIVERNFAAAMAIGATPDSVVQADFNRVTQFVKAQPAPKFPYPVDAARAQRGAALFQAQCAACHAFGSKGVGTVTPIGQIGTDPHRLASFTSGLVATFHSIHESPFLFDSYSKTQGYSNLPIDGAWARAPYLHNGSVPTLWDLLQPVANRPKQFYRGYNVYDPNNMGFVHDGPQAQADGFLVDTSVAGNSNVGHLYGTQLSDDEKRDLMEFLKTL